MPLCPVCKRIHVPDYAKDQPCGLCASKTTKPEPTKAKDKPTQRKHTGWPKGKPRKTEILSYKINFRLTQDEMTRLSTYAASKAMKISDAIRSLIPAQDSDALCERPGESKNRNIP